MSAEFQLTDARGVAYNAIGPDLPTNPLTYTPPPPPPMVCGTSVNSTDDFGRWATGLGRTPPVVRTFFTTLPARWSDSALLAACPSTATVVLSWKTATPAQVTAFLKTRPAGQRVYACYRHEPEDDIEAGSLSLATYRDGWAAAGPAIRAAGCVPTLILMGWTLSTASNRNWRDYLVTGAVDLLAFDSYNPGWDNVPPGYTDYATKIVPRMAAASKEAGVGWALAEFGSPIVGTDAQRVAWVKTTRAQLAAAGAAWVCWWDVANPGFDNTASAGVMGALR